MPSVPGDVERLKSDALCSFDYLEAVLRGCGLAHVLSVFEEVLRQIVDHGKIAWLTSCDSYGYR